MASQMVGQSEPARDCLPQAGPDGPMVVEHLGTVPHELCRELLLEMGDGRTRSGDTYRLFVGGAPTAWWSSLHREPPSAVGSTSDDSPPPLVVMGMLDQSSGDRDFPGMALGVVTPICGGLLQVWSQRRPSLWSATAIGRPAPRVT